MADRRSEIPKEFTLREQALVVHQTARMREEFITRQRGKQKMSDEDMNLQAYNVAVLDAAARTLKKMAADAKGTEVVHPEPQQSQPVAPQVEENSPAPAETSPPAEERMVRAADDDGF